MLESLVWPSELSAQQLDVVVRGLRGMRSHAPGILPGATMQATRRLSSPGTLTACRPTETADQQRLLAQPGGAERQLCSAHDTDGVQESDDRHIGGGGLLQFTHSAGNETGEGQPSSGAASVGRFVRHEDGQQ